MSDPGDWVRAFEERLNAGDLDGVLALYDADARLVPPTGGPVVVGHEGIRPVIAELIAHGTRLHGRIVRTVVSGDVALVYTDWEGTTTGLSGAIMDAEHRAIELVRRQPDGSWKLIVGDPAARG